MMDLSSSMLTLGTRQLQAVLGAPAPRALLGASLHLLQQGAEATGAALPAAWGREWRELANKLEAFTHFQHAPEILELTPAAPVAEGLSRARALGPYRAVWSVEGLGYALAESAFQAGEPARGMLALEGLRADAGAVLPLYTGAALSFAGRALQEPPRGALLPRWLALWNGSAPPATSGLFVEALGLVARNLTPHRVPRLADEVAESGRNLRDCFWHGVGRGLYFTPTHALPVSGAHGRVLAKARDEPPDGPARDNALAGLAWALTLVNIRHPEILAGLLWHHGDAIRSPAAFADGVSSALLIWRGAVGHEAHLAAFLGYRPPEDGSGLAARWAELVLAPAERALRLALPRPAGPAAAASLFRYRRQREEVAAP